MSTPIAIAALLFAVPPPTGGLPASPQAAPRETQLTHCLVSLIEDVQVPAREAGALINLWHGRRLAILVDAVRADPAEPGRIHRLVVPLPAAATARTASSHSMSLGEAVDLARELDRLPDHLLVFAVEAADTSLGVGLSPAVAAAADQVVQEIVGEVTARSARRPDLAG